MSNEQLAISNEPQTRQMKDSGVEWIGEIPEKWETMLVKNLFDITRGRVIAKTEIEEEPKENYYPVYSSQTANNGVLGYIPTHDYSVDSLTWTTDGAKAGTVFLRRGKYSITNVCGILTPKSSEQCLEYLHYSVSYSASNCRRADINGYKIMSNEMAVIPLILPPLHEQQTIAAYLDRKCTQIDTLIANQQQQIEKLKAYKQSVITETVTKGLDPDVAMKDSGVEWIGEIPEHWELIPLKYLVSYNDDIIEETTDSEFEFDYIDISSVEHGRGITKLQTMKFMDSPSRARRIVKKDDVILSTVRTYLKAVARINNFIRPQIVSTGFIVLRAKKDRIEPGYLSYSVLSNCFISMVESRSVGISYPAITASDVVKIQIPIPSINVQQKIAAHLDKKCSQIDKLIALKQQKIEKLQQYKKSLIYEYVTGKKQLAMCN